MEVHLFGPVTVSADGRRIDIGGPLHQLIVAILVTAGGRHVRAESLRDQIWSPDDSEARQLKDPRARMYELVSDVRRALSRAGYDGQQLLRRQNQGYSFVVERDKVDLFRFHDLLLRADQALKASGDDAAVELFRDAFRQWGGAETFRDRAEPFAGLNEAWAGHQRMRLTEIYQAALARCAEAELRLGRHRELIAELQELSSVDPFNEHVAGLLMAALYGAGRFKDALDVFTQVRQRLFEELGNEPGAALQDLHRRMLNRDAALSHATPSGGTDRTSIPVTSPTKAVDPYPVEGAQAMDTFNNNANDHATVGFQASVVRGHVYATSPTSGNGLDQSVRKLRRKLQEAHSSGKVSRQTMSAAEAELATAQSHLGGADGTDIDGLIASLENFQRLVDDIDELVDLADVVIDTAQRAGR